LNFKREELAIVAKAGWRPTNIIINITIKKQHNLIVLNLFCLCVEDSLANEKSKTNDGKLVTFT
jgi:hypothetical protein